MNCDFKKFSVFVCRGLILVCLCCDREWRDSELACTAELSSEIGREHTEIVGEEGSSDSSSNRSARLCRRKRGHNGSSRPLDFSALKLGMSAAWKSLYIKRWPTCADRYHGAVDWQQLYWETHLQWSVSQINVLIVGKFALLI